MNLCIDIGNTTTKTAVFNGDEIVDYQKFDNQETMFVSRLADEYNVDNIIVCSTIGITPEMKRQLDKYAKKVVIMSHNTPVPITNLYSTPETLGMDRLTAVVGAWAEKEGNDILVIDNGTAITYDFINSKGEYLGGNISPGVSLRFRALNEFTKKLPLINAEGMKPEFGINTETAIRCGVVDGVKMEIEGFINKLLVKYPYLLVFLTGGYIIDFDKSLKKRIFVDKLLVLRGLNKIMAHINSTSSKDAAQETK